MRGAVGFAHRPAFRRAGDGPLVAQILVQLLAREGKEGREHHLQSINRAQSDVQNSSGSFPISRDELPRLVLGEVLIDERGEVKQLLQCGAKSRRLEVLSDFREPWLDGLDEALVFWGDLARPRELPKSPVGVHERAMCVVS